MKILLLTNKVPYPANDGSSIAMASMVDGFLKNGAQVTLLSLNTRKHFKSDSDIQKELPAGLDFYKIEADTNVKPLGAALNLVSGAAYHVSRFYQKEFVEKLLALLKSHRFDIIQLEGLSMAVYLDLIRKHSTAPVTLRAHNVEYQIWERHIANEPDYFQRAYLKIQVRRLQKFEVDTLKRVDAVIAITTEDEKNIRKLSPGVKSTSIPCGIDLEKTTICDNENYLSDIGYLASFDWLPNVQGVEWFLKKVWPVLKKQSPDISFRLGGRHMPAALQNLQEPGISTFPEVPVMKEFVCGSRIAIIPLLAGSGMRIKIIENMALGKCQVSTPIGAEGITLKDGHDILLATDENEFADQILKILKDSELRSSIEKNARATIEKNYSNTFLGKQLLNFYEEQLC